MSIRDAIKRREKNTNSANATIDAREYVREKYRKKEAAKFGLDTFESDLKSMGTELQGIYDGWQTQDTMKETKPKVQNMYNRIKAYREYQKEYGGADLSELENSYKTILGDWDNRSNVYSQFKNADAYAVQQKQWELRDKYEGLTFDEVQEELKKYKPGSDEYKFLSNYTGYKDLNDFDKAIEYKKKAADELKKAKEFDNQLHGNAPLKINDPLSSLKTPQKFVGELLSNALSPNKTLLDKTNPIKKNTQNNKPSIQEQLTPQGNKLNTEEAVKSNIEEAVKSLDKMETLSTYLSDMGYGSIAEIESAASGYDELEKARNQWALDNTFDLYDHYMEAEDFEENSQYWDGHVVALDGEYNPWDFDDYPDDYVVTRNGETGKVYIISDPLYEYVNKKDSMKDGFRNLIIRGDTKIRNEYYDKGYDLLYPEELAVFNYIDKEEGRDKALEYLEEMSPMLTKRRYDKQTKDWEEAADSGVWADVGLSLTTIPASIVGGIGNLRATIDEKIKGEEYNPYHRARMVGNFASDTRGYIAENIAEATEGFDFLGQNIPSFLYQTGMSIGDTTVGAATMGPLYSVVAGSNAFQQKAREMKEAGEDEETIFKTAFASGTAEMLFEYISLDKLLKIKNIDSGKRIFTQALKQAGIEGSEELATEFANIFSDLYIRGDSSTLDQKAEELKKRGYTESEINSEINKEVWSQLGWAAAGGFLSGLGTGVTSSVKSYARNSSLGKGIKANDRTSDMLNIASLTPQESEAYEAYTRYANKGINADNISNAQLGNLYATTNAGAESTLNSKKSSDEQKAEALKTKYKLLEVGTENKADKISKELTKNGVAEDNSVASSGKKVDIAGIKLGDDVKVVTAEGKEISVSDITPTQRDADLLGHAETMSESDANLFIKEYDGKTDVNEYADSFNLVKNLSEHTSFSQDYVLEHRGVLTPQQAGNIYIATREEVVKKESAEARKTAQAQQKEVDKLTAKWGKTMTIQGEFDDSIIDYDSKTTDGSKVNWDKLSGSQRDAIGFAKLFSKATGVNIKFIKSEIATEGENKGKHVGKNGSYDPSKNLIEIDVYAGRIDSSVANDAIIPTLSHEMTHWMKYKMPAVYNSIRDDVLNVLKKEGNLDERIGREIVRMNENHSEQNAEREDAIDELVARACEDMLSNSNAARKLLAKMNPSEQKDFISKVKETFDNIIKWINDLLARYKSNSEEAKILREYKNELKKISKQWDNMLLSSIESNQALQKEGIKGEELAKKVTNDSVQYSIREEYAREIDEWVNEDKPEGETFILGSTGDVLQGLGAIESDIYMLGDKINEILESHPEMTIEEIKKIPQILENPVLILKSQNVKRNNKANTRLVIFGNVKAKDGKPILSVLDLRPVEKNLVIDDMQKVSSAYTKDSNPIEFIRNSDVLYVDKKRTTKLLTSIGFQMPIELQKSGYIGSISYFKRSVNIKGEIFSNVFKENVVKNSDRDTLGNTLTEAQQNYFAESKARDENGNLKMVYHGTRNADFTVFNRNITYFTDDKSMADSYSPNGDMFEGYVNITKPYEIDAKGDKWSRIPIDDATANFLKEYGASVFKENGKWRTTPADIASAIEEAVDNGELDYDGIIIKNIDDTGSYYKGKDTHLATDYIIFNKNQFKNASNKNPTVNKDIRFSMRENVEETKDLVAVHNLSEEKLLKSLQLGGLPMPSIAITRAREGYTDFGNISLVFNKETIDPQFISKNKVFSGDAWTPTYPRIDHKVNDKAQKKIANRINNLVPEEVLRGLGGLHIDSYNLEQDLNRHNGNLVEMFRYNTALKYAFLTENGVQLELPNKFKPLGRYSNYDNNAIIRIAETVSEEKLRGIVNGYTNEQIYEVEPEIRKAINDYKQDKYKKLPEKALAKLISEDTMSIGQVYDLAIDALNYLTDGIKQEVDYYAARDLIDETIDAQKYEAWIKELFANIVEKEGIRNNKDMFTPSGNRRSFEALHYEHNLENVIKAMKEEGTKGIGTFGRGNIFGASTTEFQTITDIKDAANERMKNIPQEEYEAIKKGFSERFFELAYSLPIHKDSFTATDSAANMLIEAVSKFKTKSGIANYIRKESQGWAKYSDYVVDDLIELVNDIRNMPVGYFEAKPQRAVEFNEVATAIIPDDSSDELKTKLNNNGIKFVEYESKNEESRLKALNSLEDVKFSDRDSDGHKLTKEQIEYFKDSKVRDEKGRLLAVYHGTKNAGFTKFAISDEIGYFFARSLKTAQTYSGGAKTIYAPDKNSGEISGAANYKSYLNIKKPYIVDGKGANWNMLEPNGKKVDVSIKTSRWNDDGIGVGKIKLTYDGKTYSQIVHDTTEFEVFLSKHLNNDMARAFAFAMNSKVDAKGKGEYSTSLVWNFGQKTPGESKNTRDVVREAYNSHWNYDGVIFKDVVDSGDGTKIKADDLYVVFNSNQIKSVKNTNPTSDPDIRYSDRDNVSVYDKMGETNRLIKENEQLKEDVERLKERLKLERQITHGNHFNRNQLNAVAAHIRNKAKSDYSKVELIKQLEDIYSYIATSKDLNWQDLFSKCYDVASMVLDEARPVTRTDDYYKMILNDIRGTKISVNEQQIQNARYKLGNRWRNSFFNKVKITDNAISLDSQWKEWSQAYPDVFDAEIVDADQLVELYDIYDSVKESSEVVVEYDTEEQTRWLAKEIYNQYWNVSPIRTTAEKYTKQIKLLNYKHREAMNQLRDSYKDRLKTQHKADKKKAAQLIKEIRDRKDKEIAEVKQKSKERMEAYKENAERKAKIQSITAKALTLNEWLIKNSKEKHIHESLKGPVANLLQAIDFSSKQLLGMREGKNKGMPTQKDISLQKALGQVKDMMLEASVGKEELVDLYGHDLDDDIKKLVESVDNIMRTVGDNEFILNQMTLNDLKTLDNMLKTIKQAVTKMNQFHSVHHAQGIASLGQKGIRYAEKLGNEKAYVEGSFKSGTNKMLKWSMANPYYAFKRFGEAGRKIFEAFQDGWDKLSFNSKKILDFTKKTYKTNEVRDWEKEVKSFDVRVPVTEAEKSDPNYKPKYQKVQITPAQVMYLYLLNKRSAAKPHLLGGGIKISNIETKKNGVISQPDDVLLEQSEIDKIINSLTKRQIEVANELSKFLNTVCTDWGNEISMLRFGYKAFEETDYVPMNVDKDEISTADPADKNNSLFKLLNMSFTKGLTEGANNRLVISSIFDIFAQHTSDMAKYNALALPVLDAFKWYNYKEIEYVGEEAKVRNTVKKSIGKAFGKDGQNYITTFLEDINGQNSMSRDKMSMRFFKNAKLASVGANLRVIFLQPTSYFRASVNIDNKYLIQALAHKPKIAYAEKYCGMALWKSLGYYDINIQRGIAEQIKHAETGYDKLVEWSMKGAGAADRLTLGYLWNAAELELRKTRKDLKAGSEEFFLEVGKRLRDIIYSTQVVDSTMTRSEFMRSPDGRDKILSMFASEPTLAYNILQDAYIQTGLDARELGSKKAALKKNAKKIARAITAYTVTNAVAALVESGFDALRDDEEEEMDIAEFMKLYFSNFAADMSIVGKIPYFKDGLSIFQGYSPSRLDVQWMQSSYYALKGISKHLKGEGNPITTIKNGLKTISYLSGLAFFNAYRDGMAVLNKMGIVSSEELEEWLNELFDIDTE